MCIFCEIASKERCAQIVYEDALCIAFLDADPIQEGHMLLIPKAHYLDADDMPEALLLHLTAVARKLIGALKRAYAPDGYGVMQNGGQFNDIGHFHLHLFPRYAGDGFGWTASESHFDVDGDVADKIRRYLR